jgi:hypothetical protein
MDFGNLRALGGPLEYAVNPLAAIPPAEIEVWEFHPNLPAQRIGLLSEELTQEGGRVS